MWCGEKDISVFKNGQIALRKGRSEGNWGSNYTKRKQEKWRTKLHTKEKPNWGAELQQGALYVREVTKGDLINSAKYCLILKIGMFKL